jgi:predicted lipoprotein with Yx(FWY)xxD motif
MTRRPKVGVLELAISPATCRVVPGNDEENEMSEKSTRRPHLHRFRVGRIAIIACVAGALASATLTSSAFAAGSVKVSTASSKKLGTYLVSGKTLYTLNKPTCTGKCLTYWPALLLPKGATRAVAGPGVNASMLGTKKVAAGLQVTYGGKPLYFFSQDKGPGKVTGNNVKDQWGLWSIVVTVKPKSGGSSTTTTTAPSGGGVSF